MTTIGGLGQNVLTALKSVAATMLTDTCTVKRQPQTGQHTPDGAFGFSDTLTTVGTYACFVDSLGRRGGNEDVGSNRVTVEERYFISFPAGTDIKPQDRITQASSGITYVVTNNIDSVTGSPLLTVNAAYASK